MGLGLAKRIFAVLCLIGVSSAFGQQTVFFTEDHDLPVAQNIRLTDRQLQLDLGNVAMIDPRYVQWSDFWKQEVADELQARAQEVIMGGRRRERIRRNLLPQTGLQVDFLDSFAVMMRDFIDRFERSNDRLYWNFQNFRLQLQQLMSSRDPTSVERTYLHVEAIRLSRNAPFAYDVFGGGVGFRFDMQSQNHPHMLYQFSMLPFYAEVRRTTLYGRAIDTNLINRLSIGFGASGELNDWAAAGIVLQFQPFWRDFGNYRTYQELYVKLSPMRSERGHRWYRITDLVIIPRIIHWHNTDFRSYNFESTYSPSGLNVLPFQQQNPAHEIVFMQSVQFHFSFLQ